jgi:hypothetical protein
MPRLPNINQMRAMKGSPLKKVKPQSPAQIKSALQRQGKADAAQLSRAARTSDAKELHKLLDRIQRDMGDGSRLEPPNFGGMGLSAGVFASLPSLNDEQ